MDISLCDSTPCGGCQKQGATTEAVTPSHTEPPSPIETVRNEVLLEIFLRLDGAPTDFISVKGTCCRFAEFINKNELAVAQAWTKKQTGVKKILLENIHAHNRRQWTAVRCILEGHQRAVAIVSVASSLEEMGPLADLNVLLNLTNDVSNIVHRQRRCTTILLGAEICALEAKREGLTKAMATNEKKSGMAVLGSVTHFATMIVWQFVRKARKAGESRLTSGDGDMAIEGLCQAIFT